MMLKSIEYLEGKMDRAIEDNDINGVEKVLDLLSKVKEMIWIGYFGVGLIEIKIVKNLSLILSLLL